MKNTGSVFRFSAALFHRPQDPKETSEDNDKLSLCSVAFILTGLRKGRMVARLFRVPVAGKWKSGKNKKPLRAGGSLRLKATGEKKMKVRASVKRRCEFCQIIKRNGKIRVICSRDARHKQCQG